MSETKNIQLDHVHHLPSFKKYPLSLFAHNIDIPMNVGSLFRIADAFGIEKIYLSGSSPTPPNSKIRKTSRATEKYVSFSFEKDPLFLLQNLRSQGYTILSLEITSDSVDIRELSFAHYEKICLIIGSENTGVSQEFLDLSDKAVHIPMLGHGSSMNVATACSIAIFEIIRSLM
ncbi:TrmH family RNA methyltransferase [Candidatus Neptunochlamydia vexilliferae]|uniref:TrmH family RNA methyltransferase n=1 Tax=Candidatus Neptunichlamydia vexilliferae TaxID=1651774 RepID=UPI001890F310|nr:TrmH family RNA methyltransferase [Candidatus Neptunochlamydia vexilliferae]